MKSALAASRARGRLPGLLPPLERKSVSGGNGAAAGFGRHQSLLHLIGVPRGLRAKRATYVDQVLKGSKSADLPVQLPTTMEPVVNLKNGGMIGRSLPETLWARADNVIE